MNQAWLCYWFDELEIKPTVVHIVFEDPDLDTRAKYHRIVPIVYSEIDPNDISLTEDDDADLPFFLKKQAE